MNPEEFLELVAEMSKAQRLYFADRSARALDYAKKIERQIDWFRQYE